ncbi:hypothetical protein [Candidatus Berkiella aquae]|uniref:Uncharacterized protein n=1 Tax=Candidatus Berkiella aquae TaxID=295108 RepID=A0A0Q9Z050_9GAMM|nr:hypothetical protein [Candidatus Berkiella aquae]MCS5710429.1 hypothetical protein [Candidatus Berkiella aquae]
MTETKAAETYATTITNLVTISAAGLAGSVALFQFSSKSWLYIVSIVCMSVCLLGCFLTLAGLTGEIKNEKPNLFIWNIRYPSLLSFFVVAIGFIAMAWGLWTDSSANDKNPTLLKMLECRQIKESETSKKSTCYDSYVDSYLNKEQLKNASLDTLNEEDKKWVQLIILKLSSEKK